MSRPPLTEGVLRDNPHPPSPVGEGLAPPADLRLDPTNGLSRTPAPTQQTKVLVSLRTSDPLPPLKGEVSPALAPVTEGCLPRPHRVIANQ